MEKSINENVGDVQHELQALFDQARAGELKPSDFCAALEDHGIHGVRKLPHVVKAFNTTFADAKDIVMNFDGALVGEWAEEVGDIIEELPSDALDASERDRHSE